MKKVFKSMHALLAFMLIPSLASAETIQRSIATVNGEAIFLSDFQDHWDAFQDQQKHSSPEAMAPDALKGNKKLILDQMIEEKLLLQEAKRRKIVVPKRQLEEGLLQIKNRFKDFAPGSKPSKEDYERELTPKEQEEFAKELKKQGLSEQEFQTRIDDQLKVMRLTEEEVRSKIPTPFLETKSSGGDEADRQLTPEYEKLTKDLYEKIEKRFNDKDFKASPDNDVDQMVEILKSKLGESVHARHIFVKSPRTDDVKQRQAALAKIQAIKKELDGGADFVELAKKKSEGPTAQNGGDLGFFTRGQMSPEFDKTAFQLPVGGISDVVETEYGYHIILVEEKRASRRLRYDDIKSDLAGYIFQEQMQSKYEEFVSSLRKKADIKILMDLDKTDRG